MCQCSRVQHRSQHECTNNNQQSTINNQQSKLTIQSIFNNVVFDLVANHDIQSKTGWMSGRKSNQKSKLALLASFFHNFDAFVSISGVIKPHQFPIANIHHHHRHHPSSIIHHHHHHHHNVIIQKEWSIICNNPS